MAPKKKPAVKEKQPAGDKPLTPEDLALQHTVYYNASTSEIKDDILQLASCWKTGHGALTKQEAGLLLWYHCHTGEDVQKEVIDAGVINTCVQTLDNPDFLTAEKSTAAGILLTLCQTDAANKDAVVRAKAGPNQCCQVLHNCIAEPEFMPRHVVALLASLASSPQSLSVLLKAVHGAVPWSCCHALLEKTQKDHAAVISTADYVRCLVTGHADLAAEAAAAGLLHALLTCAQQHKSAGAVAAAAACLQALCEVLPENRSKLGKIAAAIQILVDLLGPPPESIIAWEQQEYRHILFPPPPTQQPSLTQAASLSLYPQSSTELLAGQGWQQTAQGKKETGSSSIDKNRVLSRAAGSVIRGTMTPRRAAAGAPDEAAGAVKLRSNIAGSMLKFSKSGKRLDIADSNSSNAADEKADRLLQAKQTMARRQSCSMTGSDGKNNRKDGRQASQHNYTEQAPELPHPTQPLLCKNITGLKWEGPVPDATRCAVAGVLSELVQLPELCKAVRDRLGASRLATLLQEAIKAIQEGGGKKGAKKSKKSASLTLTPENEAYLCNLCVCLRFLVAADNADCYRVAASGCLPALVQIAAGAKQTHLRQSAKAVLSQVCVLSEVQDMLHAAEVPEEMLVQVPMKLVDSEVKLLQVEFPTARLQQLSDIAARARI